MKPDTVRQLTERREAGEGPSRAETERVVLAALNHFAERSAARWYPTTADGLCAYCGLKPKAPILCVSCETRRQNLSLRYPDLKAKGSVPV